MPHILSAITNATATNFYTYSFNNSFCFLIKKFNEVKGCACQGTLRKDNKISQPEICGYLIDLQYSLLLNRLFVSQSHFLLFNNLV